LYPQVSFVVPAALATIADSAGTPAATNAKSPTTANVRRREEVVESAAPIRAGARQERNFRFIFARFPRMAALYDRKPSIGHAT